MLPQPNPALHQEGRQAARESDIPRFAAVAASCLARRKGERVPVPAAVAILAQTLEALAKAHDQGVIHRDVTPGNVLLAGAGPEELLAEPGRDPGLKLAAFGIAGLVEQSGTKGDFRPLT